VSLFHTTAPERTGRSQGAGAAHTDVKSPWKSSPVTLGQRDRWLIDSLLLICLFAFVCVIANRPAASVDEDLWWHMSTGAWILKHRTVPTHDVFAAYTAGKPWIAYTWLFDVISSKIYSAGGLHGILTLTMSLTIGFIAALVFLLARYATMLRAVSLTFIVVLATIPLISPRPWLFTCIFFVLELHFLLRARDRSEPGWLLPVVPLIALWANLHIQFVYGLAVIGLFAVERPLARTLKWDPASAKLRARWFWILLTASILGTLINPYGWRLYAVVAEYATQSAPLQVVQEMQAMQFREISDWAVLFLASAALFALGYARRKCTLMLSLMAVALWFGFHTARDVWFLAVVSALAIACPSEQPKVALSNLRLMQLAIALPPAMALAIAVLDSSGASLKQLQEAAAKRFPVKAAEYIESHALKAPLYNPYGWGGYLIWRLPAMPVSIDGRADLQGDARVARFAATWTGRGSWAADPELMRANTIILESDCGLASILRSDQRFRLLYDDGLASVFQPVRAADTEPPNRVSGKKKAAL
jgi:hypothetical protein